MSTAILDQARIETATEVLRGGIELIDSLAEEWRALSDENPRQPFCRPEWIRAYYRCFAPKATLLVVTVRSSGRLTAVLPLIEEHALFYGLPAQKLSGAVNIHSYRFDAACRGGAEGESAIACIWQALKDLEDWDLIEFAQMPEDGALASLMARAQSEGYPTGRRDGQQNAFIPVTGWDGNPDYWLLRSSRHFRHTFRTAARKLPEFRFRRVTAATPEDVRAFFDLERSGWKGAEGTAIDCSDATRDFYSEIADAAGRFGYQSMYFLEADGKPIAAQLGLTYGSRYFALKCAYDESYSLCAPGHIIVNLILNDCAQRGLAEFEFLGPVTEWKAKWTNQFHQLAFFYVFRKNVYGRMLHAAKFQIATGLRHVVGAETGM